MAQLRLSEPRSFDLLLTLFFQDDIIIKELEEIGCHVSEKVHAEVLWAYNILNRSLTIPNQASLTKIDFHLSGLDEHNEDLIFHSIEAIPGVSHVHLKLKHRVAEIEYNTKLIGIRDLMTQITEKVRINITILLFYDLLNVVLDPATCGALRKTRKRRQTIQKA